MISKSSALALAVAAAAAGATNTASAATITQTFSYITGAYRSYGPWEAGSVGSFQPIVSQFNVLNGTLEKIIFSADVSSLVTVTYDLTGVLYGSDWYFDNYIDILGQGGSDGLFTGFGTSKPAVPTAGESGTYTKIYSSSVSKEVTSLETLENYIGSGQVNDSLSLSGYINIYDFAYGNFGQDNFINLSIETTGNYSVMYQYSQSALPEVGSWALMSLGFGAVGAAVRRKGVRRERRQAS